MELKHWGIGGGVLLGVIGIIFGMITVNVNGAISKCENAQYGTPVRALTVTSCPADEDYAHDSIALVVANVSGSPEPTLSDEADKYLRNSLALANGDLDMFIYSTTPGGQRINTDSKKVKKAGNVTSFVRNASKKLESINEAIKQPPVEDGSDYFNNIITAARAVKTSPKVESPLVLVIGSGLSDTQPLNFADSDLLHSNPGDVLNNLKSSGGLIANELSGVRIVWSGLGVTAVPQQPLDATEKRNLNRIYTMVFEYMGATFVADDTVMASDSVKTDTKVRSISVNGLKGGIVVYRLGENAISFTPDTAKISDTNKANTALDGLVKNHQSCRGAKITVEGYQALLPGRKTEETTLLSQERADAVKRLLISRGIPATQITATGRGSSDFEGRIKEINSEGKWDETRAQANRVVIVKMQSAGMCN